MIKVLKSSHVFDYVVNVIMIAMFSLLIFEKYQWYRQPTLESKKRGVFLCSDIYTVFPKISRVVLPTLETREKHAALTEQHSLEHGRYRTSYIIYVCLAIQPFLPSGSGCFSKLNATQILSCQDLVKGCQKVEIRLHTSVPLLPSLAPTLRLFVRCGQEYIICTSYIFVHLVFGLIKQDESRLTKVPHLFRDIFFKISLLYNFVYFLSLSIFPSQYVYYDGLIQRLCIDKYFKAMQSI